MKIVIDIEFGSEFQKWFLESFVKLLHTAKVTFESKHKKNKFNITIEED